MSRSLLASAKALHVRLGRNTRRLCAALLVDSITFGFDLESVQIHHMRNTSGALYNV